MPILDDILSSPDRAELTPPRLRAWKSAIDRTWGAKLEVLRPTTSLGSVQSEMSLRSTEGDDHALLEPVPWDDELNAGLIQLGLPSINAANEADRFALGLRAALRKSESDLGDGYFNSVLYELVAESRLMGEPEIADIIKHAYAMNPNRESKKYGISRDMIAVAIGGRMQELTRKLQYPLPLARQILVSALARYLDSRFTVSSRRRLGLL